jgi:HEAT repeat protein
MTSMLSVLAAVTVVAQAPVAPPPVAATPPAPRAPAVAAVAPPALAAPAIAPRSLPPASWAQEDPADSLYRVARRALNRNDYRAAIERFREIRRRYPRSSYTPDAYYWEAFALYRVGGIGELREAHQLLQEQLAQHAQAGTRRSGESATLAARIDGELARRGDAAAAARVRERAEGPRGAPPAPPAQPAQPAQPAPPAPRAAPAPPAPGAPAAVATPRTGNCPDEDDEDDPRVAALNALLHMDAESALPILRRVLARRDACSVGLRRKAVFLVSQKRSPETTELLLDAVRSDPDREVRENAVFWLSQVKDERTVAILDSILQDPSTPPDIQEKAIFALSQQRSPRAGAILRAYAERPTASRQGREQAIFWLGQRKSQENAEYLRALYGRLDDPDLREKVIFSVSQIGGAESTRWLLGIARDSTEPLQLRKNALFWAGQGGAATADLVALYDRMPDREMREQLIFVYSQRKDAAAVDKLFDIARREPDPELRRNAIFWLGQSKDPRVVQFLNDLINEP